jgi:hypothetical protein
MHRLAQFHAISRPAAPAPTDPAPWDGEDPPEGNLPAELLRILCATLAEHTSTPRSCWFCLWDGYGWLHGSPSVAIMGNHFWPLDQAWCVASEIDLLCTLVAGSDALAGALAGDPRLEAWRVQPDDPIAFDSDQVNS